MKITERSDIISDKRFGLPMIFEVTPEQIASLSDEDLRALVGYLAEQEANQSGLPVSGVTYGGHQNAPDGGIDVRAHFESGTCSGFIPRIDTGYQVKAEDFPASAIKAEMRPKGVLRASIVELAKAGGAYVIVSSKGSVADNALKARKKAMRDALAGLPEGKNLDVDFYDRRRLATWVNQHPGLIPWVRSKTGLPLAGWKPYDDWSSSPGDLDETYIADDSVRLTGVQLKGSEPLDATAGINALREILHQSGSSVRLVGLSGVGKTRLVQALFDDRVGENPLFKHDAIYADLSDSPAPIPQELLGHLISLGQGGVLIIDNCGVDLHKKLTTRIKKDQADTRLITVEYDVSDDEPEHTDTFKLEPASKETITKVIERRYPSLTDPEIGTISEFSEGNARVALALAATASYGDSLTNLKDSELIERLFFQKHQKDPALLRTAKALSLVYSFDGETLEGSDAELPRIAELSGQSVDDVHAHVAELYRRQLVQKRSNWRALLPHALAHKLATQALQDFPLSKVEKAFVTGAPERLLKSFSRRLGCLHTSEEAKKMVASWLNSGGLLADLSAATETELIVLENVAPVDPGAVLSGLHAVLDSGTPISDTDTFYRVAVSLFRSFAYEPEWFDEALSGLLKLVGDNEPSNNSSDAASVFQSLFYMYLSGTHAGPEQRIKFIEHLSASNIPKREELVLAALDAMLECMHFMSAYGFDFGTRKRDFGYRPKTYGEKWNWFHLVYDLVLKLSQMPEYRDRVRTTMAEQFCHLATYAGPPEKLIELAEKFAADGGWSQGWAGARRAWRKAAEGKDTRSAKALAKLSERLRPETLDDLIAAYVLPARWGAIDVAEIDFDDEKKYQKAQERADDIAESVGSELAADEALLRKHLPNILNTETGRGFVTARGVGRSTKDPNKTWKIICDTIEKEKPTGRVDAFLGGFLEGLTEHNSAIANDILDDALTKEELHRFFVYMQAVVGIDERGIERLVKAASIVAIPTFSFQTLGHGRTSDDLSPSQLRTILEAIVTREDGLHTAIDIFHMRIFSKRADKDLVLEDERDIARWLLLQLDFTKKDRELSHNLELIVSHCLTSEIDNKLIETLCSRLKAACQSWMVSAWDYGKLVRTLLRDFPETALSVFVDNAEDDGEIRREMFRLFRDNQPCPFSDVKEDRLLGWAAAKPNSRYERLAHVMRPWIKKKSDSDENRKETLEWDPRALAVLNNAPDKAKALRAFIKSFRPTAWSGSYADVLASKLPLLEDISEKDNSELAEVAKDELKKFKADISDIREREEAESRKEDERFEW